MWIMTQEGYDDLTSKNIIVTYNDNVLNVGDTVPGGKQFTFTVTGRKFLFAGGFDPITGAPYDTRISDDGRVLTVTAPSYGDGFTDFSIELSLPDETDVESVNHVNNVYRLKEDEVVDFVRRYYDVWLGGESSIDYSKYLLGLIRIPFKIDDSDVVDKLKVRLYNINIGEPVDVLDSDKMTFTAGTITVPTKYNNLLDYQDTDVVLHLPFTESTNIDPRYVIGHTLTIKYHVNLYNGIATVSVHSTMIDGIIHSENIDLDARIPFANPDIDVPNVPRNLDLLLKNESHTAFVEVVRGDPVLPNSEYMATVDSEGVLENVKGFIKVDEIEVVGSATSYEKELIHSILEDGVIIK